MSMVSGSYFSLSPSLSSLVKCVKLMVNRVVSLASMAFGIVGIIACLCCKDVDSKMTNKVCVIHSSPNYYPPSY